MWVDASQPLRCGPPHADTQPSFSQVHISGARDVGLTAGTPWASTSGAAWCVLCQDCPKGTRAFEDLDAAGALELLAQAPSRV